MLLSMILHIALNNFKEDKYARYQRKNMQKQN
jgi:hypothetical protein